MGTSRVGGVCWTLAAGDLQRFSFGEHVLRTCWQIGGLQQPTAGAPPSRYRHANGLPPRSGSTAYRWMESQLSGVRRIRFHDLRHSCASLLWSQGVPLEQIQDILGHADPRTTKVIYVDVAEELQREAVDKLGFLFDEPKE